MLVTDFFTSFILGLLTPLTAVCVLPLYPGFLSYLTSQFNIKDPHKQKRAYALFGVLVTFGVILFMFLLGLLFTTIFQISLTNVIGVISPIAFGVLSLISILLIFNVDLGRFLPKAKTKLTKKPLLNAVLYGFFFGAIVVPCNPAFIGAFFARAFLITSPLASVLNFIFFGIGLGFPLLMFSLLSSKWSTSIIGWAIKWKYLINRIAGIIMLIISLYYLIYVFKIFG
jgi:cytochrome c-type biogenesis protein